MGLTGMGPGAGGGDQPAPLPPLPPAPQSPPPASPAGPSPSPAALAFGEDSESGRRLRSPLPPTERSKKLSTVPARPSPRRRIEGVSLLPQPLIGRQDSLVQLDALLARAVDYQAPQLVTVVGGQGVGKTRLVSEWISRLTARHATSPTASPAPRILRARAIHGAPPYSLIRRILRDRFGIAPTDDQERQLELARTELSTVFGDRRMTEVIHFLGRFLDLRVKDNAFLRALSTGTVDDPRHEDTIARAVLRRFLELDAERAQLILAFDDLHLADDDSLTLIGELAAGLGGSSLLIIAAARNELFIRRPRWGQGDGVDHTRLELAALTPADAERLVRGLLVKAEPLPATLVADACRLTSGNPFFIEELVRVFFTNGTLTPNSDGNRLLVDTARAADAQLPLTVEEAVEARISSLTPLERDLLEKGATLGTVFWLGAIVVLTRIDGDATRGFALEERVRIEAALEELVERDFLTRAPSSLVPGDVEYTFKHALEHGLIGRLVSAERARRYHRACAEWLETRLPRAGEETSEHLELYAQLLERGGQPGAAAQIFFAAADKARSRYANDAAAELYARGLALCDREDCVRRLNPLHNYGDVLQRAGKLDRALEAFEEMRVCAWRVDHPAKAGAAHSRIARIHRRLGDYDRAEQHLAHALELFRRADDLRGVAASEDDLGKVAFHRGEYSLALERHGRALDLRRALGDPRSIALSLHNLALVHQASGGHGEAVVRLSEALALRREIGDLQGVVQSLVAMGAAWRDRGDVYRSHDVLRQALDLAAELGDRLEQAVIQTRLGEALLSLGRASEAAEHLQWATESAVAFGDRLLQSEAARLMSEVYIEVGDLRAARDQARRALELADKVGSRPARAVAHRALGTVLARGGISDEDKAEADRHFSLAIEILGEVGAELELGYTYRSYARALQDRGDLDGAATFADRAEELTTTLGARIVPSTSTQ